jgi:hypothetical protein
MSVDSLWSVVQIAAGLALAVGLGSGPGYWLLPREWRRYALAAAPAAGYALFCLAAVSISVNFRMPANAAVWIAFALLAATSVAAVASAMRSGALREIWAAARPAAPALAVMLVAVFWPVIYQGTSLYLGTANPDFYQSLAYHEVLSRFGIGALDPRPALDYSLDPFFGTFPDPIPAKFGGVMFSMLLGKVLFIEPRTALMTALVVFLLALPVATYFFTKVVLEADDRVAAAAAVLMALGAPVTMSFIHVLVGQNSSLALMPLGLAVGFLAVRTRDWRVLVFALLILDATFWIYVAILPYVGAPLAAFALYDLARNRRGALRWLAVAAGVFAVGLAAIHLGMARETRQLIADIVGLLGRANRSVYVDFLTEMSLPYSVGLSSYPLASSLPMSRAPAATIVGFAMVYVAAAMLVLLFFFRSLATWARRAAPQPRAFVLATVAIYLVVWLYFNFVSLYGYAIFKMASWLQFLFMPFVAYGLVRFVVDRPDRTARGRIETTAAALVGAAFLAANVVSTIDFDMKGLGRDTHKGAIVNSYGIGGNPDYPGLEQGLAKSLPAGSVVAIAAPDFIANLWTSYYVIRGGMKASFVSHDDFPDEDVVLPDLSSGFVTNSAGNTAVYKPRYHADDPRYFLLEGPANLNREIVDTVASVTPIWSNGSFILAEAGKARDVLVTRRGFYRLEYFDRDRFGWWWPERMRWTPEGGEFLLIHASRPGQAHRLSFVAIPGKERERPRHIEIWVNGAKIDEQVVHAAARVVTRPFIPTGGIDRIVVKVRERVGLAPRNFGLWNRHIATDQRYLNLVVAQARVLREGDTLPAAPRAIGVKDLIDRSGEFDGVSLDGWVAPEARFTLPIEAGATRARLRIEVPGWAGYRFPLRAVATVNGAKHAHELAAAGTQVLEWPIEAGARELAVALESNQSAAVPGTGAASFRIESLAIE